MKSKNVVFFLLICMVSHLVACVTGQVPISSRSAPGYEKEGSNYVHSRLPAEAQKPDIYVKKKELNITPTEQQNDTGSLFKIDDARNHLFVSKPPMAIGQFVTVRTSSQRADIKPAATKENENKTQDESSGDQFVGEMLKALPELEPADAGTVPIKQFKMKVASIFENGDALLTLKRTSENGTQGNSIDIRARVSFSDMASKDDISTNELLDVHWVESDKGTITERYSAGWEDEYTLRLSGFSEAKSKMAVQLEDKRKNLEQVKDKLHNQLVSLGKERKQWAAERDKLMKERSDAEKEKAEAEQKQKELEAKIQDQEEQIKDLQPEESADLAPEEKPNDQKASAKDTKNAKPAAPAASKDNKGPNNAAPKKA